MSDLYNSYKVMKNNEGQAVQTISSREVAEMMEVRHDNLMNKIEKHTKILKKVNDLKIKVVDLWQLSSYEDAKGEIRKEYKVTKKGCEFLAHKTTGEKGDLFTIRYMDKFEAMEKALKEMDKPSYMIEDPIERAEKWIAEQKEKKLLQEEIKEQKPKVIFADAVASSEGTILIRELAKILKQNGIDTGEKRLYSWLRNKGYLIKQKGADYNTPTQRAMDLKLFEVKETSITNSNGSVMISKTTKVTGKGQIYFINKLKEEY